MTKASQRKKNKTLFLDLSRSERNDIMAVLDISIQDGIRRVINSHENTKSKSTIERLNHFYKAFGAKLKMMDALTKLYGADDVPARFREVETLYVTMISSPKKYRP